MCWLIYRELKMKIPSRCKYSHSYQEPKKRSTWTRLKGLKGVTQAWGRRWNLSHFWTLPGMPSWAGPAGGPWTWGRTSPTGWGLGRWRPSRSCRSGRRPSQQIKSSSSSCAYTGHLAEIRIVTWQIQVGPKFCISNKLQAMSGAPCLWTLLSSPRVVSCSAGGAGMRAFRQESDVRDGRVMGALGQEVKDGGRCSEQETRRGDAQRGPPGGQAVTCAA